MKAFRNGVSLLAIEIWLPLLLVVLWWTVSEYVNSLYFPPLRVIMEAFAENWLVPDKALSNLVPSLQLIIVAYSLAVVAGIVFGTTLGLVRPLERAVRPIVEAMRAVPGVALLPLFIVLFGIDQPMRILLVAFGAMWPVLLNTLDGVRGVEPTLLDMTRSYRVGRVRRLFQVILKSAGPQIFAGARISLAVTLIIMVVAETVGADGGVGYFLMTAKSEFRISAMWSAMVALGILGYILNIIFRIAERYVLRWHRLQQARLERTS
ncbi:ABC-type nitrate/sulfonate/bicarbonate transport system permease component [Microbacterium ginsengiterrae]|uniref:ABC-type nitrate/sulfonate/bicarbonate transport system permease component n=1 Tax=Microbacterium ginsengiterrae TaxID=546115 RepID=A0A7W9CC71_9MICO|nr:ABC transporter permease [Microbacterium ginsengiterrae]MBB5742910.1 ABC-type nitrate/sulfonate/bicarbonate transport system permease component [Microbacterium ginsengiterrae]